MKSFTQHLALCFLIAAGMPGRPCPANSPGNPGWIYRAWQTDDGLPNNDVNTVAQDAEGFMLVATSGGLARFDGLRLLEMPPDPVAEPGESVTGVQVGRDGTLWQVTRGQLVSRRPDGSRSVHELEGLSPSARLTAMFEAAPGELWIGFEFGPIFICTGNKLERAAVDSSIPRSFATQVCRDAAGGIWAAGPRALAKWRNGQFEKVIELPDARARLCASRNGGLWIGCEQKLLAYTERDGIIYEAALPAPPAGSRVSMMLETPQGLLWIGTFGAGLYAWDGRSFEKVTVSNHDIWWLGSDHENNLWVGTGGGGVCRVRARVLSMMTEKGSPVDQTPRALCQDTRGDIWVVLQTGELYLRRNGDWQHLVNQKDWPMANATCVVADRDGNVWVASNEGGLARWDGELFQSIPLPPRRTDTRVRAMLVTREGRLWFNRGASLLHGQPGGWITVDAPPGGAEIASLAEDMSGTIWAAGQNAKLYRVQENTLVEVRLKELAGAGPVRTMLATPDGAVWMGTARGGLVRYKGGNAFRITTAQGLWSDSVSQLVADSRNRLWGAGARGVFVAPLADLNAVADGRTGVLRSSTYGREEGVPSIQANSGYVPNTLIASDGRIWFATRSGIVTANPFVSGTNHAPPPVAITGLRVDGRPVPLTPALAIPPGVTTLRFELAAMSYVSPESVIVQHQIPGLDGGWMTSGPDRTAVYGRLAPGHYTLQVRATNNDGLWSRREARLAFTVEPFFWQTTWFLATSAGLCFGATAFATHRISAARARRQAEHLRREAEVHRERTRIARDMHDQMGASLTRIMLLADLAQMEGNTDPSHVDLAATARQMVTDLDEIVWAVNPKHDHLASLLEYISQQAADLLQAAGIRCRLDMPGEVPDRPLPAEFRHHLFLIVREAVNNAVKYSAATEVRIQVQPDQQELVATVADNGRGLPEASQGEHRDGLNNMKARAESLGGSFSISSSPNVGTTVCVRLPWPPLRANP